MFLHGPSSSSFLSGDFSALPERSQSERVGARVAVRTCSAPRRVLMTSTFHGSVIFGQTEFTDHLFRLPNLETTLGEEPLFSRNTRFLCGRQVALFQQKTSIGLSLLLLFLSSCDGFRFAPPTQFTWQHSEV
eukprot:RCo015308